MAWHPAYAPRVSTHLGDPTDEPDRAARAAVLANWRAQLAAMDAADTDALAALFTPDATLTHMTGYVQALPDWMAGMAARQFVYHRVIEKAVDVSVTGAAARLNGRILTGVTDDGSGQTWRLRVEQDLRRDADGRWRCTASRVTTW